MFLLDTNVVSELGRQKPSVDVQAWYRRRELKQLFLSATVIAEIAMGVERLPQGHRRRELELWLDRLSIIEFCGRILSFDEAAARIYGRLMATALRAGRPTDVNDGQIAAVAECNGLTVATCNSTDFAAFGIPLVNPWTDA